MVVKTLEYFSRGILFGVCFYMIFIQKLNGPLSIKIYFGLTLAFTFAIGNCVSKQFRCISILVIPSCFSKVGKTVIHAIIVTYVVSGPFNNIAENTNQIIKIVTCSSALSYNITRAKLDLMLQPFIAASKKIKPDLTEINGTLKSLDNLLVPITQEMENPEIVGSSIEDNNDDDFISKIDADKYENQYSNKMTNKCNKILENARTKCNKHFVDTYRDCTSKTILIGRLFCWPVQLSIICGITNVMGHDVCDAKKQINPGVGEEYTKLLTNSDKFKNEFQDVNVKYTMNNSYDHLIRADDMKDVTEMLKNIVLQRKIFIDRLLEILHVIFSLLFLRVILSAQHYHNTFHKKIDFDNKFINDYFIKIDKRRKLNKKSSLFPLNKIERKEIFFSNISILRDIRLIDVIKNVLSTIFNMFVPLIILLVDRFLYEVLCTIRKYGEIQYYDEGSHVIYTKLKGTGMMATLVRSMVKEFNQTSYIHSISSNLECLPTPSALPFSFLCIIFGCYLLMFIISMSTLFINQIHRLICGRFYPKHEKKRTLYLYNKMLKKRKRFYHQYEKDALDTQSKFYVEQVGFISRLKSHFPWISVFFTFAEFFICSCVICGENRTIYGKYSNLIQCMNCKSFYCLVCWKIIGEYCHICNKKEM